MAPATWVVWPLLVVLCDGSLVREMDRVTDLREFSRIVKEHKVVRSWMDDDMAKITVFAEVDDVFLRYPSQRSMQIKEVLGHIVDVRMPELSGGQWRRGMNITTSRNQIDTVATLGHTVVHRNVRGGRVYVRQFEHNPGNFSYFANNGRVCNHVSTSWYLVSGQAYLYKICSPFGHDPYPGDALGFIKDDPSTFSDYDYNNAELTLLRDHIYYFPSLATLVFGNSAWTALHTFFLPNNDAFRKVPDRKQIHQEVLLAHATIPGQVLFAESWLYDYGVHYISTIRLDQNFVRENYRLKLAIRNITNFETGRWELYAVSTVYEFYSTFRRGSVWARIVTPNIPVTNGVVHIVDTVLGVITNTIEQLLDHDGDRRFTSLMLHVREVGMQVLSFLSAYQGQVTFFAPTNEAFKRIPREIENRLLRDRLWLNQVLRLHIVPGKLLLSEEMTNHTIVNSVDENRRLYFIKGEWPIYNITHYVVGGGVRATIRQEDVAATNGLVHYIDRVLGVPYQTMFEIVQNETDLRSTYMGVRETNLRFMLDPWEVVRPEQNFTFFVPTDEAWAKLRPDIRRQFFDGYHWIALQFVFKRHMLQGQALMLHDLRERSFVMMNNQRVVIRRRGRWWQLYWPYGNVVAQLIEGGEIAARNGFMHKIDNVMVLGEDLDADSPPRIFMALSTALLSAAFALYFV